MNKELKGREYNLPPDVIKHLNSQLQISSSDTVGTNRAKELIQTGKVNYGQLKRILHDLKSVDKTKESQRYNLYGGDLMEKWASKFLKGERDLISNKKDSKMKSQNIAGTGIEKNSHLKSHSKKPDWLPPTNLIKSNSHKSSISPITSMKLFEEVERIKKLML